MLARQRPHEISIPPSSPSDTLMTSDAGGDLTQMQARGDPELSADAVNQRLREELQEWQQSYLLEVQASQRQSQELKAQYGAQAWRAIQFQHERFHETAQKYEEASADVTEAAVAQERATQRAAQQQLLNSYQAILIQTEARVQQQEWLLQRAQRDHAEALEENYSHALAEQRAQIVTEAEDALMNEKMQQQHIKAEYMRSMAQTHAANDNNLKEAFDTIYLLQNTVHRHELQQAELQGIIHRMQSTIDKQNLHMNKEMTSAHQHNEAEIRGFEAQQAHQAQEYQQQQREREQAWQQEMSRLAADLHQSQLQGQAHAQRAHTLQDQLLAEKDESKRNQTPNFHRPEPGRRVLAGR